MKSKLFNRLDITNDLNKPFVNDFIDTFGFKQSDLEVIIKNLPAYIAQKKEESQQEELARIAGLINADKQQTETALDFLYYFFTFTERNEFRDEKIEDWADDLFQLPELSGIDRDLFIDTIRLMKTRDYDLINRARLFEVYQAGVLPRFDSLQTTIELRAVVEERYRSGNAVANYQPKVIDLIPIISCNLSTDSSENSHLFFQATIEDINTLITELEASIIIAKALKTK